MFSASSVLSAFSNVTRSRGAFSWRLFCAADASFARLSSRTPLLDNFPLSASFVRIKSFTVTIRFSGLVFLSRETTVCVCRPRVYSALRRVVFRPPNLKDTHLHSPSVCGVSVPLCHRPSCVSCEKCCQLMTAWNPLVPILVSHQRSHLSFDTILFHCGNPGDRTERCGISDHQMYPLSFTMLMGDTLSACDESH